MEAWSPNCWTSTKVLLTSCIKPNVFNVHHMYHVSVGLFLFFCLHILAIINNTSVNISAQVFVWTYVFISLGHILGVELLVTW